MLFTFVRGWMLIEINRIERDMKGIMCLLFEAKEPSSRNVSGIVSHLLYLPFWCQTFSRQSS